MPLIPSALARRTSTVALVLLAAAVAASAAGATPAAATTPSTAPAAIRPAGQADPDYAAWAALGRGSWVKVRIDGSLRRADWVLRLAEVTPAAAVVDVTETRYDREGRAPWRERIPAAGTATDVAPPAESGRATLVVGGQPLVCRWETRRRRDGAGGGESGETTWVSPAVPGFVKRVSWLAADPATGLSAAVVTEAVVGYELRPVAAIAPAADVAAGGTTTRPATAPAAAGPAAEAGRRVGEPAGPTRFQWTYGFEPRGWRRWERTGPSAWVERWQTGEEVRFRVDRHVIDGERAGVVVRRLPDEDLETVVPDDGAGATIWFRHLPDGEWTKLGEVETAE